MPMILSFSRSSLAFKEILQYWGGMVAVPVLPGVVPVLPGVVVAPEARHLCRYAHWSEPIMPSGIVDAHSVPAPARTAWAGMAP